MIESAGRRIRPVTDADAMPAGAISRESTAPTCVLSVGHGETILVSSTSPPPVKEQGARSNGPMARHHPGTCRLRAASGGVPAAREAGSPARAALPAPGLRRATAFATLAERLAARRIVAEAVAMDFFPPGKGQSSISNDWRAGRDAAATAVDGPVARRRRPASAAETSAPREGRTATVAEGPVRRPARSATGHVLPGRPGTAGSTVATVTRAGPGPGSPAAEVVGLG